MLTEAEAERLTMLKDWADEIANTCQDILEGGYQQKINPDAQTNEDYFNEVINKMLTVRGRMYEEGDLKSKIPNFSQMWRDMLKIAKHQG